MINILIENFHLKTLMLTIKRKMAENFRLVPLLRLVVLKNC